MLGAAGIALGVVALLAVPVDVAFAARRRERVRVRVAWLWGRLRLPLPTGDSHETKPRKPRKRRKPRPGRPSGARRALAALRTPGFPRRVLRLAQDLKGSVHVRRLELSARVGLGDPADTGRLWGLLGPAVALLPRAAGARVTPDFDAACLHLDAEGEARVVPAVVLGRLCAFALSPATLRAARAAARGAP